MHTIHAGLNRSMRLAAIAGIVAFLSFPVSAGRTSGYGAMRWLNALSRIDLSQGRFEMWMAEPEAEISRLRR